LISKIAVEHDEKGKEPILGIGFFSAGTIAAGMVHPGQDPDFHIFSP